MRNTSSPRKFVAMLSLTMCFFGCASLGIASVPPLEMRTLRFSPDAPTLEYQYWVCVKKFLWNCTKTEMKVEKFDLADPVIRKQLIDMGFVARVREKP